jgi:quinolinate synthase
VKEFREQNPDTLLIAYVNTTAAAKSEVDICCTSGNAEKIVAALPKDQKVMFLPDANLGGNLVRSLERPMGLWDGCCPVHNQITPDDIRQARAAHPGAVVMVHPECPQAVRDIADEALSTGGMCAFAKNSPAREFIVGTEVGILHRLEKENPGKKFFPANDAVVCWDMKKITLEKLRDSLLNMQTEVVLDEEISNKARSAIESMLKLS